MIDPDQWRYEKLVESVARMIESDPSLRENPELLRSLLLHILGKVYAIGRENVESAFVRGREEGYKLACPVIPVTDLTHIPELFAHISSRWDSNRCN